MSKVRYVAGLLFSLDKTKVTLVKKNRPDWQKGRFNAIGGRIEEGESPEYAMRREFFEEAGVDVHESWWEHVALMEGEDWELYFYRSWGRPENCKTQTDEDIYVFDVNEVLLMKKPIIIGNLSWLLPLSLDTHGNIVFPVIINYAERTD